MINSATCVSRLEDWFNKKLKGDQFEMFMDRIRFIPPQALDSIVTRIIDDNPPTPGRFPTPNKIKAGWEVWKAENPQLVIQHPRTDCHDCGGEGFLWFKDFDQELGQVYEYVAKCGACENWKKDTNEQSPIVTKHRSELVNMGLDVFSYDDKARMTT